MLQHADAASCAGGRHVAECGRRHGLRRGAGERRCVAAESGRQVRTEIPSWSGSWSGVWTRRAGSMRGGRAVASGHALPRRLGASMQQRLDLLSSGAGEVVRVAAVLPDRFSAGLLAAMLDRQPSSLMSALEEAVRADLLVEDGEQLRFRHDLLREATRQSLPQSLRRAMERQSASIMLSWARPRPRWPPSWRAAPSPETGRRPMRCAKPRNRLGHSDAGAAADLSSARWSYCPPMTLTTGCWWPKRWGCSTGPAAIRRPKSWPLRRSRRRRRPKRRPRFGCASRRSPSTVPSGASRRIVERWSWATSARSPGRGIWRSWPTT